MERIASFQVDHTKLKKGVYISRVDKNLITYDIRMCQPNIDKPLDPMAAHVIEHIGATLLRNGIYKDQIIYFGPMGCLTGFYLIAKNIDFIDIKNLVKDIFLEIATWDKEIPGASLEECGNYSFMDLDSAKKASEFFLDGDWEFEYDYL